MGPSTTDSGVPDSRIIKEGGYQPTSDPGPVPASLIRQAGDEETAWPFPEPEVEERLVKALAHTDRAALIQILSEEEEASANEMARRLGMSLGEVAYHFKLLHDNAIIEKVRVVPHRGSVVPYYRVRKEILPFTPGLSLLREYQE